ncbi:MAG: glycosyltransferase family 4 protein [Bacteroidales bacterium]
MKSVDLIIWGDFPPKTHTGISIVNSMIFEILVNNNLNVIKVEESFWMHSFGRKLLRYAGSFFKIIGIIIFRCVHKLYFNIPLSVFGLIKLKFILFIIRIISPHTELIGHIHRGDIDLFVNKSHQNKLKLRKCLDKVDKIIVLSNIYVDNVKQLNNNFRVFVMGNTSSMEFEQFIARKEYNANFVCISNYIRTKGIGDLVRAFGNPELAGCNLTIFGNIYEPEFYEEIKGIKTSNVNFEGAVQNSRLAEVMNEYDCLILPSWNEGQPLVILEAMSIGIPVIATGVGDISNMLGNDYPFITVPHDVDGLIKTVIRFNNFFDKLELARSLFERYQSKYSNQIFKSNVLQNFIN